MHAVTSHWLFIPILVTVAIIALFPLVAGYLTLVERKVLADFQVRLGPMRTGPHGLLQPIADALKLMLKEDIIPTDSDKAIFWFAPVISTFTGLKAFAVQWRLELGLHAISRAYAASVKSNIPGHRRHAHRQRRRSILFHQ